VTQNQFLWRTDGWELHLDVARRPTTNQGTNNSNAQVTNIKVKKGKTILLQGARGVSVETLRYKPEGRGFDSRLYHWNFSLT
jgi:hypothetical protein